MGDRLRVTDRCIVQGLKEKRTPFNQEMKCKQVFHYNDNNHMENFASRVKIANGINQVEEQEEERKGR